MRGYPILTDNLSGRLSELDRRIARLEQPHDIRYAQSFNWVIRSQVTEQPIAQTGGNIASQYWGVMTGPSLLYVLQGVWDGTSITARVYYDQVYPTPTTSSLVTLATSTVVAAPGIAGASPIVVDIAASGIQGTFGSLILNLEPVAPDTFAGYLLLDAAFITSEYEPFVYGAEDSVI